MMNRGMFLRRVSLLIMMIGFAWRTVKRMEMKQMLMCEKRVKIKQRRGFAAVRLRLRC